VTGYQLPPPARRLFALTGVSESGEGAGGYAREMSPAFIAAEMALFKAQAAGERGMRRCAERDGEAIVMRLSPGSV
jgi:hypothetical protein